jgi:hypothetical protein
LAGLPEVTFTVLMAEIEGILADEDATKDDLKRAEKLARTITHFSDATLAECETGSNSVTGISTDGDTQANDDSGTNAKKGRK